MRRVLYSLVLTLVAFMVCFIQESGAAENVLPVSGQFQPVVVIPGKSVSPAMAAFSGAWEGSWSDGGRSGMTVYRVEEKRALLLHEFTENPSFPAKRQWVRASVITGERPRLTWKDPWTSGEFSLSANLNEMTGILGMTRMGEERKITVAMKRKRIDRIDAARLEPPFACPGINSGFERIAKEKDPALRRALVDELITKAKKTGTPLVESGAKPDRFCATFIYRGTGDEIAISGDLNGWSEQRDYLNRVGVTDLYYYSAEFPADSRIEYKLVSSGVAALDPLNPRVSVYGRGANSEAPMGAYRPPPEVEPVSPEARGRVENYVIAGKNPAMSRTATVYLPVGYDRSSVSYPVLYLNDAFGAIKFGAMINVFDNLIHRKAVPPFIVVLLPSVGDRIAEYSMNPQFEAFVAGDVVPAIDRKYRTIPNRQNRIVGGISAGATAALSLSLRHSELFGKCMAQSTATKLIPLLELVKTGPKQPIRTYLDVGRFESEFNGSDLVQTSHRIREGLERHGCPVRLREVNEGHGWKNWRARTGEALAFLFAE